MAYKHIFFDLDRTLWDFEANMKETIKELFNSYLKDKINITAGIFISHFNHVNETLWKQYRQGKINKEMLRQKRFSLVLENFDIEDNGLATKMNSDYMDICPQKVNLIPYTIEILTYLKEKYNLYILTNGFKETQQKKITNCKLDEFFKKLFTSEDIGFNKPRPEIFAYAINSINAKKTDCLMIGDDIEIDISGAKNYGIDQVLFNPKNIEITIKPTYVIQSLKQLEEIL